MGTETWYQAIPDGCRLLGRSISDPQFGEFLTFPSRFRDGENCVQPVWKGEDAEFCEELRRLIRAHPGLETRNYTLDRYYDMVEYLISEARRGRGRADPDLGTKAVRGATVLAEHLRGGQGHLLRYNSPDEVTQIAEMLFLTTEADLRRHYDPAQMEQRAVYKFVAERADEQQWGWICDYFGGLAKFYQLAAAHCEGVMVTVT